MMVGDSVTLSVFAIGPGTLSYQWVKDGKPIVDDAFPKFTGCGTPTLQISSLSPKHNGSYKCVVSTTSTLFKPDSHISDSASDDLYRFPYGKQVQFDLAVDINYRYLAVHAIHHNATRYKVKAQKVMKRKYRFIFHAREPGIYLVHILDRNQEIPQSPVLVLYGSLDVTSYSAELYVKGGEATNDITTVSPSEPYANFTGKSYECIITEPGR